MNKCEVASLILKISVVLEQATNVSHMVLVIADTSITFFISYRLLYSTQSSRSQANQIVLKKNIRDHRDQINSKISPSPNGGGSKNKALGLKRSEKVAITHLVAM